MKNTFMIHIQARLLLILITLVAFTGPFIGVMVLENIRRDNKLIANQEAVASVKKDADAARYEYYLGIAQQREVLQKSMADAKTEYDKLVSDQSQLIQDNKKTVTQTTTVPVVTQKVTSVPVTTYSAPKSSTKTKTS